MTPAPDPASPPLAQILRCDPDDPQVIALLNEHRIGELVASPRAPSLRAPNITSWAAWLQEPDSTRRLVGLGALRALSPAFGEVKSMHTAETARRRGVGAMMLRHIMAEARERGYARLSLETGSRDAFAPARALYRAHGFTECGPFGDYELHPISIFMTIRLS